MTWTAKAAMLGDRRFPYLDAGDPQSPHVLLLIHAFPVGMRVWDPVMIPPGWRGLAPALPGFDGAPPPPAGSSSLDDYAGFVLDFLDALGVDSAVLGGLSMGGYVSFALWRLDRLRWRGLVLADTRAGADTGQGRLGREKMLEVVRTRGTSGVADEMLPKLLGDTTRAKRPHLVDRARRMIERQTSEGVAAALVRLRDRPDSTPVLADITVPVLLLVGDEDVVTPAAESEQMGERLEDARVVRISEAGHLSCFENPGAFNAGLAAFLVRLQ